MGYAMGSILLSLSLAAIVFGWRGRRVGDTPHCRRCRFDLTGLFPSQARCPECGNELRAGRAVVLGDRRRRWVLLTVGLILALGSVGLGVAAKRQLLTTARLVAMFDNDTLISWSLKRPGHWLHDEANVELKDRIQAGKLSATEQQSLLDLIVQRLAVNRGPAFAYARHRLMDLNISRATSSAVQSQLCEYVIERWSDPNLLWLNEWGYAFDHRFGGVPSLPWTSEAAKRLFEQDGIPTLRLLPAGGVQPGELFIVTTSALRRQPKLTHAANDVRIFELPSGVVPVMTENVMAQGRMRHAVTLWWQPVVVAHAPTREGKYLMRVTQGPYNRPEIVHSDTATLNVSTSVPSAADLPIDAWLARRTVPVTMQVQFNRNWDRFTEILTVEFLIAAEPGNLTATGRLIAVRSGGTRQVLDTFAILPRETIDGIDQMPRFAIDLDSEYIETGSPWKVYLAFDTVLLPDGRSHEGPEPLMVELPADLVPAWGL
jgi:hypothetical protein